MSEPKAKVADIFATVRARAVEYLRRIPPAERDRLATWAGAPAPGPKDDRAELCAAAAATSEGTRRILAAIHRDARDALLFLMCGMDVLDDTQCEGQVRDFFGWPKARARAAIDALFQHGLLSRATSTTFMIDAFPALRLGLGADLPAWLTGASDDVPTMPFARRLALLVAHAHADPATLTAQSALTVRWMDRTLEVFAATEFSTRLLAGCVAFLGRAGALGPDPSEADGKTWRVEPRALETLAAAPADLALAFADTSEVSAWGTALGTLTLLERARVAGDESPTLGRLSELGKAWVDEHREHYVPYFESQFRPLAIASALRTLRVLGLVSLDRTEGGLRVRPTTPAPAAPRPFRCTVLPTFEIWVAPDADLAGTAELGRIADLSSTDRVAKFTLTQKSLARAAREPGGAATAIERLAAAAEHGLPDNVRATLEGWARRATSLRAYRGGVIVAATDEQATFVRGRSGVLGEIAPGVFHVESEALAELLRTTEKAGHVVAPVVRDGRPGNRREAYVDPLPLAKRADEVRAKLAGWAKPPPKAASSTKARPVPPRVERPDVTETSGDDEPLSLPELRREWPEVAAAVKGFEPLLAAALRLSIEQLDDLLDLPDKAAIRGRLAKYAFEILASEARPPPPPPKAAVPAAPAPRAEPSASADAPPWFTPKPGELVQLLAVAALRRQTLDIIYINSAGARTERRIVPLEVLYSGRREWLSATVTTDQSTNRFELDRIVAVRVLGD